MKIRFNQNVECEPQENDINYAGFCPLEDNKTFKKDQTYNASRRRMDLGNHRIYYNVRHNEQSGGYIYECYSQQFFTDTLRSLTAIFNLTGEVVVGELIE